MARPIDILYGVAVPDSLTGGYWVSVEPLTDEGRRDLPYALRLLLAQRGDRTVCIRLEIDAPDGIEAATAKRIRIAHFVNMAALHVVVSTSASRTPMPPVEPMRGRKGYPPEHWQRVADLYREAMTAQPRAPIPYIAKRLPMRVGGELVDPHPATVARWVAKARSLGLLGDATPGKPGERNTP